MIKRLLSLIVFSLFTLSLCYAGQGMGPGPGIGQTVDEVLGAEHSASDDCADDNTGDWSKADCTAVFDTDHYEITRTAGTQSFYKSSLTFVEGQYYKTQFSIKDGTASGETVSLAIGDTFYGGEALNEAVVTTASWVTHTFYFTAGSGTEALSFQSDLAAGNYELKDFSIRPVN